MRVLLHCSGVTAGTMPFCAAGTAASRALAIKPLRSMGAGPQTGGPTWRPSQRATHRHVARMGRSEIRDGVAAILRESPGSSDGKDAVTQSGLRLPRCGSNLRNAYGSIHV